MQTKTLTSVEVKDAAKGHVTAVFATLDVVDKDGDVTVKGAFRDGAKVAISDWNHTSWQGAKPVGKGTIREDGKDVVCEMQFFMSTTHGREAFETVKSMHDDGPGVQWSYGFDVLDAEPAQKGSSFGEKHRRTLKSMQVHEVSPVMIGAGVDTRVTDVKAEKKTFAEELTDVVASVKAVRERAADVMAMRAEKGKGLGEDSASLLKALCFELAELADMDFEVKADESESKETLTDEQIAEMRRVWLNSVRIAHEGVN